MSKCRQSDGILHHSSITLMAICIIDFKKAAIDIFSNRSGGLSQKSQEQTLSVQIKAVFRL